MISEIIGHPGTGKTTTLTGEIEEAVKRYGSSNVVAGSFTKAAARELLSHNLVLPENNIGTLHSHAYRAIGGGKEIADTKLSVWNEENPNLLMSGGATPDGEGIITSGRTEADIAYSQLQIFRNQMLPRELWRGVEGGYNAMLLEKKWNEFKQRHDLIDFTDIVEIALRDCDVHPENPVWSAYDEFQDFTRLEISLWEKWFKDAIAGCVIAGDPNQSLYAFKGANPNYMLDLWAELPQEYKRVLNKSMRVPKIPQRYASAWIQRASRYMPADYEPKDGEPGFVRNASNLLYNEPGAIIKDMEQYLKQDKSVMIMASCSYMIDPIKYELKRAGIPFHNPYRAERQDWNPLNRSGKGISSVERILAFTRPSVEMHGEFARMWTWEDVYKFADVMAVTGNMKRSAKKDLEKRKEDKSEVGIHQLLAIFEDSAFSKIMEYDVDWYIQSLTKARQEAMEFPGHVMRKHGMEGLLNKPKVTIGTNHVFKGTQAEIVYMSPDLSVRTMMEMAVSKEATDAVIRMMYVGMTRCSEGLVLCGSNSKGGFSFPQMRIKSE